MLGWIETKPQILSAGACFLDASDGSPGSLAECRWSRGLAPSPAAVQGTGGSSAEPQFSQPQNEKTSSVPYTPSSLE